MSKVIVNVPLVETTANYKYVDVSSRKKKNGKTKLGKQYCGINRCRWNRRACNTVFFIDDEDATRESPTPDFRLSLVYTV